MCERGMGDFRLLAPIGFGMRSSHRDREFDFGGARLEWAILSIRIAGGTAGQGTNPGDWRLKAANQGLGLSPGEIWSILGAPIRMRVLQQELIAKRESPAGPGRSRPPQLLAFGV